MSRINVMSVKILLESITSAWGFMPYDPASIFIDGKALSLLSDFSSMRENGSPVPVDVTCHCCKKVIHSSVRGLLNMRRDRGCYCPHCHAGYTPTTSQEIVADYRVEPLSEDRYRSMFEGTQFNYDGRAPIDKSTIFVRCRSCDGYIYGNYDALITDFQENGCPLCLIKREELDGMNPTFMKFMIIINALGLEDKLEFRFTAENMESFITLDQPAQFTCKHDSSHIIEIEPNAILALAENMDKDSEDLMACTCRSNKHNVLHHSFQKHNLTIDEESFINIHAVEEDLEEEQEEEVVETSPEEYVPVSIAVNKGEPEVEEQVPLFGADEVVEPTEEEIPDAELEEDAIPEQYDDVPYEEPEEETIEVGIESTDDSDDVDTPVEDTNLGDQMIFRKKKKKEEIIEEIETPVEESSSSDDDDGLMIFGDDDIIINDVEPEIVEDKEIVVECDDDGLMIFGD